jgi:hypothetical protein
MRVRFCGIATMPGTQTAFADRPALGLAGGRRFRRAGVEYRQQRPDGDGLAFLDQDGSNFRVAYVEIEISSDGSVDVSDRQGLFSESNIDATSGISWSD